MARKGTRRRERRGGGEDRIKPQGSSHVQGATLQARRLIATHATVERFLRPLYVDVHGGARGRRGGLNVRLYEVRMSRNNKSGRALLQFPKNGAPPPLQCIACCCLPGDRCCFSGGCTIQCRPEQKYFTCLNHTPDSLSTSTQICSGGDMLMLKVLSCSAQPP